MAQSTAGIKLYYGTSVVTNGVAAVPASWTEIPDITSIPSMTSTPNKLETTTLGELEQKTYINGLQDLGGAFEFKANMTTELVSAVDAAAAITASESQACAFKVSYPEPLAVGYWWTGEVQAVKPGEAGVDAVVTTSVYISQATSLTKIDESGVS
jgi:hypothetical protein